MAQATALRDEVRVRASGRDLSCSSAIGYLIHATLLNIFISRYIL